MGKIISIYFKWIFDIPVSDWHVEYERRNKMCSIS